MSQRSEHRAAESAHRIPSVKGGFMGDSSHIPSHYFTFPRQSNIPHGYFKGRRNLWPMVGFTVLCWLAFGAVVVMIYAGLQ